MKTFLIYSKSYNSSFVTEIGEMLNSLSELPIAIFIETEFYSNLTNFITIPKSVTPFKSGDDLEHVDYLVSLGGDGTFLATARLGLNSGIPILPVNIGRLGFLARLTISEVLSAVENILKGKYFLEDRIGLTVASKPQLFEVGNFGLNDFTIHKNDSSSMIIIHTYVDDEYLASYWADGLIISTPTGSTAYSLSCGGPIIAPGSNNLVITPIAPHNLNIRPFVIPDSSIIKLKVEGRNNEFLATLDSKTESIHTEYELKISKHFQTTKIIRFDDDSFLTTLRQKLHWGLDKRN